ncbi:hypothetical protein B566_EDAN004568 [Ephemera danica]|nr:hypothetical protein B566_EDAN004568 [Ephemera danica]
MVIKRILEVFLLSAFAYGYYAWEHSTVRELSVDLGENLTLPCRSPGESVESTNFDPGSVEWIYEGMSGHERRQQDRIRPDGSLALTRLHRDDAGVYACTAGDAGVTKGSISKSGSDLVRTRIRVAVRTPPAVLANVTVRPSTVLALLLWDAGEDGGYPIQYFEARYRLKEETDNWHTVAPEHITANVRQIDVYHLQPNSTYVFQIWATNHLGPGEVTEQEAQTHHDSEEIELARHLLEGAETFDTRVWVAAVVVVMGTLVMLAGGTFYLLYKECHISTGTVHHDEDEETIELVPNIILNPAYDVEISEQLELDENFNDQLAMRLNNNTVIQPVRV